MLLTLKFIVLAALFVGTGGAVFTGWGQRHKTLVLLAGLVAIVASAYLFRDVYEDLKEEIGEELHGGRTDARSLGGERSSPVAPPITVPETSRQIIVEPQTAAAENVTRVLNNSGKAAYSINNLDWFGDGFTDVDVSLWAVVGNRLAMLDSRRFSYIAKGEAAAVEDVKLPFQRGKVVICVSYVSNKHRVELIDFYSNETHSPQQLLFAALTKFQPSIVKVDGAGDLCKGMPDTALSLLSL